MSEGFFIVKVSGENLWPSHEAECWVSEKPHPEPNRRQRQRLPTSASGCLCI